MIKHAVILSTGDELTTGRTLDTNAHFLADRLTANGIDVVAVLTVGDYPDRLAWAWERALELGDLVVSTGGLGPTADDLTTETVSRVTGRPLRLDPAIAERLRRFFESLGRTMPENNLKQALIPEGAVVVPNRLGTAPGFRLEIESPRGARHLVILPGVPREMTTMFDEEVLPWLRRARGGDEEYRSCVFQTFGLSESALDELVAGAVPPELGRVAFRAAFPQISVRVTVHGPPSEVERRLAEAATRIRERLGDYCYAEGETTMEAVVGDLLRRAGATLAVAESCTGGLVGHRLTNVPGSSAYLLGDIVAYSNAAKERILAVRRETLDRHGAVSVEVAGEMAAGVRALHGATLGVATTGIAGPEGGTPEKPVGTVCFGLATAERCFTRRYQLWGTRDWVKLLASQIALDWIRRVQLGQDPSERMVFRR